MAKRKSELDRVVDFFLNGPKEQTDAAFATVSAIRKAQAPQPAKGERKTSTRKPKTSPIGETSTGSNS